MGNTGLIDSQKKIAYCIPVMNRLGDLEATLQWNLDVVRQFAAVASVYLISFDGDDAVEAYVNSEFSNDLASGLLKLCKRKPLPHWHFCWAKNSFADVIDSEFYSSLDADNFLTTEELEVTLQHLTSETIIHHFSGDFGDGTSGRITVSTHIYRELGYDDTLLWRQYDETSLLLRALSKYPSLKLMTRKGVDLRELSPPYGEFCDINGLEYKQGLIELPPPKTPLNGRGKGYVQREPLLEKLQRFNSNYTFLKLARSFSSRAYYQARFNKVFTELFNSEEFLTDFAKFFRVEQKQELSRSMDLTVYCVLYEEQQELKKEWFDYYKKRGVTRFVLINCTSLDIESTIVNGATVVVVRPYFGDLIYTEQHWVLACVAKLQQHNSWYVNVRHNEYLDLECGGDSFAQLTYSHNENDEIGGVMLHTGPEFISNYQESGDSDMYFFCRDSAQTFDYEKSPDFHQISKLAMLCNYAFDIKWRATGKPERLLRFPVIRHTADQLELEKLANPMRVYSLKKSYFSAISLPIMKREPITEWLNAACDSASWDYSPHKYPLTRATEKVCEIVTQISNSAEEYNA